MPTDENKQVEGADSSNGAGEGNQGENGTISISKAEWDKTNQTLGSLKRELKDLKKPKEEAQETPKKTESDSTGLLEKGYLRMAGITQSDEIKLALDTAKKWGVTVDALIDDPDFQVKLEKVRTQKANELATSGVKGGAGTSQAKNTAEYWIAKGTPPTAADVPDRKTRTKIALAMVANNKSSKTFYND